MPRARLIRPNFGQSPAMGRVGREARLLFIQIWTVADDAGRLRLIPKQLADQLFPFDPDVLALLPGWLDELERAESIQRYSVDGQDYLRVVQWRRLQSIQHPKRSRLPGAPSEQVHHDCHDRHDGHELSPESPMERASRATIHDGPLEDDAALLGGPRPITPDRVLEDLDRLQRKAEARGFHTAAARYTELMGRHTRLWGGHGAPTGRKEPAAESYGVPLEELFTDEEKGIVPETGK